MINTIKSLIIKYKELITYGLFGVATTVVNFTTFKLADMVLGKELYLLSNVIAWVVCVIFAYITNKLWVFESKDMNPRVVFKELVSFFAARGFSFIIEEGGLFLLVDVVGFSDYTITVFDFSISGTMIAKAIVGVVVVIINYFFSKLIIFRKKEK